MPRLISDGGSMIVGRRTASWTWGQFEVVLPVGEERAPRDDRISDGYVYRPDDREDGLFSLMMVRADVQIDMNAVQSDMEATLDQASRRTTGDVYYTREISGLGLGRAVPGIDYKTGDVVEVLVWGKILDLPVTAIRAISTKEDPVGAAVQVGGQPLRDPETQRKRVHDLHTQIMTERRRAIAEELRMKAQAETDRAQSSTLRTQTKQLQKHSVELTQWSATVTDNFNLLKQVVRELELQSAQWDLVAALFENYHENSGALRSWTEESKTAINSIRTQMDNLNKPSQPPAID